MGKTTSGIPLGRDKKQFSAMIDAARLRPDASSAMITGRVLPHDDDAASSSWRNEVRRAVLEPQLVFSMMLDGKHGYEAGRDCYAVEHYVRFSNQRTFDTDNADSKPMRMTVWSGKKHDGFWKNLFECGMPVTFNFICSTVPKLMAKSQYHDLTYDCVAIYILPKWDTDKGGFLPDQWTNNSEEAPDDLENRYALSFTMCNGKSVRSKNDNRSKKGGDKGDELQITFYEVHGNQFYKDEQGVLRARHCFLSEYDDLDQTKDVLDNDIPEPDNKIRAAFKSFLASNDISCFTDPQDFDKGIAQFKEQFELCRGVKPTAETCSLTAKYL